MSDLDAGLTFTEHFMCDYFVDYCPFCDRSDCFGECLVPDLV